MAEAVNASLSGAVPATPSARLWRHHPPDVPDLLAYPPDWAVIAGLATALAPASLFGIMPGTPGGPADPAGLDEALRDELIRPADTPLHLALRRHMAHGCARS